VHSDLTTKSVASLADFNKIYYTYFWATLTPCMCVMANHMYTEHTCYNAPVYRYVLTMVLPRPYSFLTTYSQPHSFCLSYVLCVAAACRRQLMWNRPPLLWRRHRRIHRRVGGGGPGPPHPEIWSEGSWIEVCVIVKYPTLNLFCLVFVLYDGYSWKYQIFATQPGIWTWSYSWQ